MKAMSVCRSHALFRYILIYLSEVDEVWIVNYHLNGQSLGVRFVFRRLPKQVLNNQCYLHLLLIVNANVYAPFLCLY